MRQHSIKKEFNMFSKETYIHDIYWAINNNKKKFRITTADQSSELLFFVAATFSNGCLKMAAIRNIKTTFIQR